MPKGISRLLILLSGLGWLSTKTLSLVTEFEKMMSSFNTLSCSCSSILRVARCDRVTRPSQVRMISPYRSWPVNVDSVLPNSSLFEEKLGSVHAILLRIVSMTHSMLDVAIPAHSPKLCVTERKVLNWYIPKNVITTTKSTESQKFAVKS
jgi:hypothetical protein